MKRWSMECDSDRCCGEMKEDPHGDYVEYSDFEEALSNIRDTIDKELR
jgi:hypothetical protein